MKKNEELVEAVLKAAQKYGDSDDRKQLTCAEAFKLAKEHEAKIIEIGNICNQHDIRIRKCQLGCFA
jgi:hypothetical protein